MVSVMINNKAPQGGGSVQVTVVTVGQPMVQDAKHVLPPGDGVEVEIGPAQFVMIDDKE